MIFEQVATGGCQSYLVGCSDTCGAALIDPELTQVDHYMALAARDGLRIRFVIDTHTHADHFSATRQLARKLAVPVVMHRGSPAPYVEMRIGDGEMVVLGKLRLRALHTPGHTRDSMCLQVDDRVFKAHVDAGRDDLIILDVRERDAYEAGHVPGARLLPRGQLELRVNQALPDPTRRILTCCELGQVSTLAAATLHEMGFPFTVALDGGMKAWREAGYPFTTGAAP